MDIAQIHASAYTYHMCDVSIVYVSVCIYAACVSAPVYVYNAFVILTH